MKYKQTYPPGHCADDFECFGPQATEDGKFDDAMIADMGCFKQDETDSNKGYHGAVVRSKKDGMWYAYFEYGRVGSTPAFIFHEGGSKNGAHEIFRKQMLSKNIKRGIWDTVAGKKTLIPKPVKDSTKTKDLYLVRPTAKRSTGLPDAKKIIDDDSDGAKKKAVAKKTGKKTTKKKAVKARFDTKTMTLGRALTGGTISYTRATLAGGFIPQQVAIEEGRDILAEATRRVGKLGKATPEDQAKDRELRKLTTTLYSRIPKMKDRKAPPEDWILNANNIQVWQFDLDAFESALLAIDVGDITVTDDPFDGMNLELIWMDPSSLEGQFIQEWMPKATANRHGHVGGMKILNMWALRQPALLPRFSKRISSIASDHIVRGREKPKFQPRSRKDLEIGGERKTFTDANVAMLFHGTRSVNCLGLLRMGMKLPKQLTGVQITGALFGQGAYWADDWKKSDGYTSRRGAYYSGGGSVKGRGAFMFVGDVALGNPECCKIARGYSCPPSGCHSVFGKAHFTDMGYGSKLQNNEWIVYNTSQINLRYLVEYGIK